MVLGASSYATIQSEEGTELAKHVEAQEKEVTEADGIHLIVTVLLSKEQTSRLTLGASYQLRVSNGRIGAYTLIRREDENLPLRRHTFRSEAKTPSYH